jgi:hypothetical protein
MQLSDALDILKARLEAIDGLTVTTDPKVPVVVPMAVITDGEMDFNESFRRGAAMLSFEVTVYVSEADSGEGLYEARSYLSGHGDRSVREALDTPSTTDDLLAKVVIDTGVRESSDNYITAVFAGRAHIPGAVAT